MEQVIYKERKNTDCLKWDGIKETFGKDDLLPAWVADMDFEVPKCVQQALEEYVKQGTFGYYNPPEGYYSAFMDWEEKYHGYRVDKSWIRFAPGVVPAINWLINTLTEEGDAVIIMQPVYYPFKNAIVNNSRTLVNSPLVLRDGRYGIDLKDFEEKIVDNDVKLFVFCSPHNPVGRVWKAEEIKGVLEICKKHKVYVISDEIHQDIVFAGNKQIPAATVGDYDEILVTLAAATKTFNLASCQNSFVIIPNEEIRKKYDNFVMKIRIKGGNAFGYIAVQSAYEGGREWFEEVLKIIEGNYRYMKTELERELPEAKVSELEGTYLLWIDLGAYISGKDMKHFIVDKCGLGVDFGYWFGGAEYAGFIRVNLATKFDNIKILTQRLIDNLQSL
jgi:cystathionine beta-lyase